MTATSDIHWAPLEANPDVMNTFITQLGVSNWEYVDVYGLDSDLLAIVPSGAIAVILLFPITNKYEQFRLAEHQQLFGTSPSSQVIPNQSLFIPQTIHNACGTMAILHSLLNNPSQPGILNSESPLTKIYTDLKDLDTAKERAQYLETGSGHSLISDAHAHVATMGQTVMPDANQNVDLHFVAFVAQDDNVVEYDGRKAGPIIHHTNGPKPVHTHLLENVVQVVREFISRDPDTIQFTLMALVPKS